MKLTFKANNFLRKYCISNKTFKVPNKHCGYCGTLFDSGTLPKLCGCCDNTTYSNPIPVAVGILPFVNEHNRKGLLLTKRAIKPFIGKYCFPGGFVTDSESWQQAITREVFEETGIITDPNEFLLSAVHSTPDNRRILIFGSTDKVRHVDELASFKPNNEVLELRVGFEDIELCFSLHDKVYDDWFFPDQIFNKTFKE